MSEETLILGASCAGWIGESKAGNGDSGGQKAWRTAAHGPAKSWAQLGN